MLLLSHAQHPFPCTPGFSLPLDHLASMLWFPSSFQRKTKALLASHGPFIYNPSALHTAELLRRISQRCSFRLLSSPCPIPPPPVCSPPDAQPLVTCSPFFSSSPRLSAHLPVGHPPCFTQSPLLAFPQHTHLSASSHTSETQPSRAQSWALLTCPSLQEPAVPT